MSTLEFKILKTENRIALLSERTKKDNGRIIKKLQRQLRQYRAAAASENA